jgi:copper chaperone CopZ
MRHKKKKKDSGKGQREHTHSIGEVNRAVLKLNGATCPSCIFAIEYVGRKISGVKTIEIDPIRKTINLDYTGNSGIVGELQDVIDKLGYSAERIE